MAENYRGRVRPFTPLIVGAVAVILALLLFLLFRGGDATQQVGVETATPPAAGTPPSAPATAPKVQPPEKSAE